MKPSLQSLLFLLACAAFGPPRVALAQTTPTIEFAAGAGNPAATVNGPTVADQVITFQSNLNNPADNTVTTYNPTITATFSLSNQQYTGLGYSAGFGVSYGTTPVANSTNTTGAPLFPLMNNVGLNGIATATANGYFTALSGSTGGIDVNTNSATRLYLSTGPIGQPVPANQRYRYADLTVTFNRPVANPVLQIVGLGGAIIFGNGGPTNGFTTELDLLTAGVTLSKLNGSSELVVTTTGGVNNLGQINNNATNPNGTTGAGAASGSVLVTTPTAGVTSLTFRLYLRPLAAGGDINGGSQTGDSWLLGVSALAPTDVATTLANVTGASVPAGSPVTYTATSQNNGPTPTNVSPQVQLPAGLTAAAFTTLPSGASYDNNSGILTLPTRNVAAGASTSYSFTFTAPNYTTTINGVASSTADVTDPTAANNNGSATNAQVSTTVTVPNNGCAGTAYAGAGGSGLYAEYYKGYFADNLNYFNANTAGITRTDGTVNFPATNSWGNLLLPAGNPVATGTPSNPDAFSSRYRGAISIAATGSYTFYLTSDDASYMWIDGAALAATPTLASALIQNGNTHSAIMVQATVTLTAGQHNILIFYGENGGENSLTFEYSGGPGNIARQIVPNSVLCPTQAATADLATTISGPTTTVVGQTVFYQATTTNLGTDATTSVVPTITLANKPAAGSVNVTNGTYDASTGIVTFNAVNLAANASVVNTVSFVAPASPTTATGKAASSSLNSYDPVATNNDGSATNANVTTTISPTGAAGTAANCATAGKDGAASLATNPNTYYPSTAAQNLTGGTSTTISVGAARGAAVNIAPGDLLLIVQMQGANLTTTDNDSYGDGVAGGGANGTSVTTNFTAGTYEYVTVASTSATVTASGGGTITLASALRNSYSNAVATTTTGQRTFQVIRVPQYTNVTLTANLVPVAWNGSTGGIVALDVDGQLNLNNFTINASGMGFRGGAGRQLTGDNTVANTTYRNSANLNTGGTKGEGIAGTPRYVNDPAYAATSNALLDTRTATTGYPTLLPGTLTDGYPSGDNGRGAPGNAGGGGTDANPGTNEQNTGGGGGANGGRGGRGGNSWATNQAVGGEPGAAFPAASSSRLVLGGGGGSGSTNNGTGTPTAGFASSGAAGGGAVLVRTGTLIGTGTILANGANANTSVANDGSGGGGSGGSILVTVTNSQATTAGLTLTANGGLGGTNTGLDANSGNASSHGPGGGGGGGVIFTNSVVTATATANGATNGTTVPNASAYGAEAGTIGVGNAAISNTIANSTAGANCIADVATTISGPANATAGSTVNLSVTFSNIGALTADNTTRVVTLPAGVLNPVATGGTITGNVINGYTITYPATSLAPGATNTYAITYTAPGAGPVVANSAITTNAPQGGLTANDNFSVSTAIGLVADVTTALTGPQTLTPGQPSGTYTASFTNEGPSTAATVTRTVTLPAGATNVFRNGVAYTPVNNVIDFGTATTLASGASNAFTFSFTPATTATGSLAIISNVGTGTSQGNNTAPDASTITAPVAPLANVSATVTANTATVAAGTLASAAAGTRPQFTVVFNNSGPATAAGVVASVQLPTGLTNVTATGGGVYNSVTGLVSYTGLTSIATGTPTTSVINFDAPASGPVVATAVISTTTGENGQTANNQASAPIAITPAFDLTTTLGGPATAVAGDLVTLNVTTTNNGPSPAANAVQTVQLPTGLTNVYVSNGGVYNPQTTTQSITANGITYSVPAGGVIFPTVASLPTGQTVANSVSFAMPTAAFTPTALVTPNTTSTATTAGDTNTANNTAALVNSAGGANVTPATAQAGIANAYTTISTSAATTTLGTPVTLTVVTGNNGPNQATGVTQTVQLQPGFTTATLQVNGVTGSAPVNNVITFGTNGPTYNTLTGLVTFPSLTNGTNGSTSATSVSNTITLTPTVATAGTNGQLLAMATVRTTNTDPVAADNVASVGVTLAQSTDLATTITGPAAVQSGQTVTYTATFTNNGPMAANNVTETAQLPAGLGTNGVTITDGAGNAVSGATYTSATGLVTFPTLTTNASGTQQVFKLSFVAPGENFVTLSNVGSATPDAVATNNSASAPTTVTAVADLATTVTGPATAVVGNPVTYTVTTTNNGPATAGNATTTLTLAPGFTATTLVVNGTTGMLNGNTITYSLPGGTTATYNTTTGLVTFPVIASLPNGTSASNSVSFLMPNAAGGQTTGVASVAAAGVDPVAGNNTASVATSIAPGTTTTADLAATVMADATNPVAPGTTVTFTATYSNIGPDAGVNVVPTLQLVPGLSTTTLPLVGGVAGTANGAVITYGTNGPSYNTVTGVLTFPTIASQAAGATGNVSYAVQVVAPNNGPLLATAVTTSNTSEPNVGAAQLNNANSSSVAIAPSFDVVTSISGPTVATAGTSQTYTVTTTNNGPSATGNVTTQTVTVPAGQTPTNISNGGVYSSAGNTITWTVPAGQGAGSSSAVANSFTIVQPTTSTTLMATVSASGESKTDNNTASIITAPRNLAPLAYAMVNSLQNPQSNDAGGLATGLLISSLNASDPENSFATQKYTVVTIPTNINGGTSNQGVLYASNDGTTTGTYTAVTAGQTLTNAQAQTLRFKAATGYVGNASFTYLTTDAVGNMSPVVNYTIPVEGDAEAVYATVPAPTTTPYANGNVIAYVVDTNGATYDATTSLVYNTRGVLQGTAVAGVRNAVAGAFTSTTAGVTSLADLGLTLNPDGRIVLTNSGTIANPNLRGGSYSVSVTTTDANGGVTTQVVSFVIPTNPLPVVLTAFTAQAVQNRDALLSWTTASEVNSASFEVERSLDGTNFTKIGQQAAKGNSTSTSNYTFTDASVAARANGAVYYRLRQVDLDATASYSPIRTVSFTKVATVALSLYPNPAQNATTLDVSALPATGTYQVLVLDATGRAVRTVSVGGGQLQTLNLTDLASGTYQVLVTGTLANGDALRQVIRLTKE